MTALDPECNADGEHVGIMMPWGGGPLQVVHQYHRCDGTVWWEDAKGPEALLKRHMLSIVGAKEDS